MAILGSFCLPVTLPPGSSCPGLGACLSSPSACDNLGVALTAVPKLHLGVLAPAGLRTAVGSPHLPPTALGAAYGTAKSGTGIAAMSVMRPELIMKSIIPVVMAGIIAIYGLVVAVLIANSLNDDISLYR